MTDAPKVETNGTNDNNDHLVQSDDPQHPSNLIPELCRKFYNWGWVTGTGGGVSYTSCSTFGFIRTNI